jgi:hypothetical protein
MKAALPERVKWALCVRLDSPAGIVDTVWPATERPRGVQSIPTVTAHKIFSGLEPAESHEIFESLHQANKDGYKGAVHATAARRKLRGVFLERKPRVERHEWMRDVLSRPANEDLAIEVLQNWILSVHRDMLGDFLDACGIEHNEGLIDDIPPQPERDKLDAAVEAIFAKHPPTSVKVYLHLFQPTDAQAWPDLDALLVIDPRLALKSK